VDETARPVTNRPAPEPRPDVTLISRRSFGPVANPRSAASVQVSSYHGRHRWNASSRRTSSERTPSSFSNTSRTRGRPTPSSSTVALPPTRCGQPLVSTTSCASTPGHSSHSRAPGHIRQVTEALICPSERTVPPRRPNAHSGAMLLKRPTTTGTREWSVRSLSCDDSEVSAPGTRPR